jgi:hypothetical protein
LRVLRIWPNRSVATVHAEGETIWTDSFYDYTVEQFTSLLTGAGFTVPRHVVDDEGQFLRVSAAVK